MTKSKTIVVTRIVQDTDAQTRFGKPLHVTIADLPCIHPTRISRDRTGPDSA